MKPDSLYYFLLSGEHPTLPLAELEALLDVYGGRVVAVFEGVAIVEGVRDPARIVARAGWVREAGRLIAVTDEGARGAASILERLGARRARIRSFRGYASEEAERLHSAIPQGGRVRVFFTEGVAIVGEILAEADTRGFSERRPGRRPFFKPGPLSPQLSRVFVNLSRLREGDHFLDPFCGTGGFVLEACLAGAESCSCIDVADDMVRGCRLNLEHYGVYHRVFLARGDAARLPLADRVVDAVATDPPYGRSTTTAKRSYDELVYSFLAEAARASRPGSCIVYAGPASRKPWRLAVDAGLEVYYRFQMHVHSSLTREIVVAAVPGGVPRCRRRRRS